MSVELLNQVLMKTALLPCLVGDVFSASEANEALVVKYDAPFGQNCLQL